MRTLTRISRFIPAALYYAGVAFLSSRSSFAFHEPFPGFDKLFHSVEFAGLGALLAFGFFRGTTAGFRDKTARGKAAAACATGWILGVLDELHQISVPGRSPDPLDAAVDALGAAIGVGLFVVLRRRRR